jgi:DNA-binding NarL/FixJ family response regulator
MKKIRVTVITATAEEYPGCADILGTCSEIEIVARPTGLYEPGAWTAIGCTDVLVLDEASLERDTAEAVRAIYRQQPMIKLLLILDNGCEHKVLDALAMGFGGIIERASLLSMVRKAIPALYAGESWVSRRLVQALRTQLVHLDSDALTGASALSRAVYEKLN